MNGENFTETDESSFRVSEYTTHFTQFEIINYIRKLNRLNICDPYNAPGVLFKNIEDNLSIALPALGYPDIYNYLINFPSSYSGDSLKSYKSLEGYKWTVSGFVSCLQMWKLLAQKNCAIITARVRGVSLRYRWQQLKCRL